MKARTVALAVVAACSLGVPTVASASPAQPLDPLCRVKDGITTVVLAENKSTPLYGIVGGRDIRVHRKVWSPATSQYYYFGHSATNDRDGYTPVRNFSGCRSIFGPIVY